MCTPQNSSANFFQNSLIKVKVCSQNSFKTENGDIMDINIHEINKNRVTQFNKIISVIILPRTEYSAELLGPLAIMQTLETSTKSKIVTIILILGARR